MSDASANVLPSFSRVAVAKRVRRRRTAGGFTLFELIVVVLLVAILAMLATPSFSDARNDRAAFDYARQYQQLLQMLRARSAGTGSAHLAVLAPGAGRGRLRVYQALDNSVPTAPLNIPGPNPVSSCKEVDQWKDAITEALTSNNRSRYIDGTDVNRPGINDDMDLKATPYIGGAEQAPTAVKFLLVCVTPAGVTYAAGGSGDDATATLTALRQAAPFNGTIDVRFERHDPGGTVRGIKRHVLMTGGSAPRLRSE